MWLVAIKGKLDPTPARYISERHNTSITLYQAIATGARPRGWIAAISTQYDVLMRDIAASKPPRSCLVSSSHSCEGLTRRPRRHDNIVEPACFEGINRTYRSVEKRRLFLQEAPCGARVLKTRHGRELRSDRCSFRIAPATSPSRLDIFSSTSSSASTPTSSFRAPTTGT